MVNFKNLENQLQSYGFKTKKFIGSDILVNSSTDVSVGITQSGKIYVSPNQPNHYEFNSIEEAVEFIKNKNK